MLGGGSQYHIPLPDFKAVIIDENAIRTIDNGIERCVIASDLNDNDNQLYDVNHKIKKIDSNGNTIIAKTKKQRLTEHPFLQEVFRRAYKVDENATFTKEELNTHECIYGENLRKLLDEAKKAFPNKLSQPKFTTDKKVNILGNIRKYFKTNDPKYLFGLRLVNGCFIQGEVEKLHERYLDKKIIYFDATMNPAIVKDVLASERPYKKIEVDVQMSDKVEIYQTIGESFSKTFLKKPTNISHIVNHAKKFIQVHNLGDVNK